MRVWLSEKDSQARDLAAILGDPRKAGRYSYQTSQGLVTAARGHLYSDLGPREYNPDWGFNLKALPYMPNPWRQKPRPDQTDRIQEIHKALRQASEVVIATDAGAEGERIARSLIIHSGYRGRIKRLWLKALDPSSIRKAISQLADGSASEGLYEASLARSKSDWLVGMNLSVLCTLLNQTLYPDSPRTEDNKYPTLQTGRVKTPTAKLVVERDAAIESFVPQDFFHLEGSLWSNGNDKKVILKYHPPDKERIFDRLLIGALAPKLLKQVAPLEIVVEHKTEPPKLAFDLLELQKACNQHWAWTAEQTLETAQTLYETHKIITYPRTDSRYLPEEQIPEIREILNNTYQTFNRSNLEALVERDGHPVIRERLYNTAKVGEHNAIVPTIKRPDLHRLNPAELQLYLLILCRYLENLSPDYEYSKTTVTLPLTADNKIYPFKSAGSIPLKNGWKDIAPALIGRAVDQPNDQPQNERPQGDQHEETNNVFPPLRHGDPSWLDPIKLGKQTTKAPQHFTEATLLEAMRRIHEYEPDPEKKKLLREKEIPGIGTPATRSKILEELKTQNYLLLRKKKELHATPKAKQMVRVMNRHFTDFVSISTTALWQQKIQQMEKGGIRHEALVNEVLAGIQNYVDRLRPLILRGSGTTGTTPAGALNSSTDSQANVSNAPNEDDYKLEPSGQTDPENGQPIRQNRYLYLYPSKPGVTIPRMIAKRPVTIAEYNEIFAHPQRRKFIEGFTSKENKSFSCFLVYDPPDAASASKSKTDKPPLCFRFEFAPRNTQTNNNREAKSGSVPQNPQPVSTGTLFKNAEFIDHGTYWKCQAVPGYFKKIIAGRKMELGDYINILEAEKEGVAFRFISSKNNKPYSARLIYRNKTKYNGKPGIDMVFD
jgi:DNA topoisomerase III